MTPLAQSLVGRDNELELLDRTLDEARSGSSRFAVVTGEPGIGKTSLLAELARHAEQRGCLALEGRAAELERELPFGLLVDAFDPYLEALDARSYDRLAADELGELASVFPALRSLGGGAPPASSAAERFRAHHAVRELIERLAARQPLLLALDDLHWSDGASLELIAHLLRRPPEAAVMVVVAYRSGQAGAELSSLIEAAARDGEVERVALGPLDAGAAARLVAVDAGIDRDRLYRDSGGNPFYLLQLARGGGTDDAHDAPTDGWGADGVPPAVVAAISAELAALPTAVRSFAQAAAVAGDPFELDLAIATADLTEQEAFAALDELVARDLVRAADVPRRFRFRHPLVRAAIYASCSPGVQLSAHARSAQALAARGAPAAARAHHVEQSARVGDREAAAVLLEAGRAASERAPSSAARWFEASLRILPGSAAPGERVELLLALAAASAATGRLEGARSALLDALELAREGDPLGRVKLIATCATVEQLLGYHDEARGRLQGALEQLPDRDTVEGAALMIELGLDAFHHAEAQRMGDWGARALRTARPLGDRALTAAAAGLTAIASTATGDIAEAEACRTEAAELVEELPDEALTAWPHALQWLSASELFLNRFDAGIEHARRGLAVVRASRQGQLFPGMIQALGGLLAVTGRLAEAAELLDDAADAARLTDNTVALSWTLQTRCWAAVLEGDLSTALETGEQGLALTGGLGDALKARASWSLGSALLLADEPRRAAAVLDRGAGGEDLPFVPVAWHAIWLELVTRCALALGRASDAERAAERAQASAARLGLPFGEALADRASAEVALASGDPRAAAGAALASAARAEELGARVDAALSRTLAGRALAQAGDTERAVAELASAAARLEDCGALRYRDQAEQELRRLGRTVYRRSRAGAANGEGVEALTGRELEVARLVVDRRTNPEIAAELFLSVKTVETHMRNIFRKLGASSRVEVARIVEKAS